VTKTKKWRVFQSRQWHKFGGLAA